jgi:hypothetical protein
MDGVGEDAGVGVAVALGWPATWGKVIGRLPSPTLTGMVTAPASTAGAGAGSRSPGGGPPTPARRW